MDRLLCMEAFVRVSDAGGFSQAARRWGCSKAVVSKYISQLEEGLDVQLFQRSTRGVTLTAAGDAHLARCRRILTLIEEADAEARKDSGEPRGPLRVSAPHGLFSEGREAVIASFVSRFPDVALTLTPTNRLVDLANERVDVAVRVTAPRDSSLIARKLISMPFSLVASPGYLAEFGQPSTPEALAEHWCVTDGGHSERPTWVFGAGEGRTEVRPRVRVMAGSPFLARDLAIRGHGLAVCPHILVVDAILAGTLVELWPGLLATRWGIYAVTSQRRHLPARARAFLAHLKQEVSSWV